jgi:competence protein ComEC
MTSSKILFFLCIAFVLGIFLESVIKIPQIFLWAFLFAAILIIFISLALPSFPRKRESRLSALTEPGSPIRSGMTVTGFCFLFLILGILRVQITEFNIVNDALSKFNGKGSVTLTGVIINEPDVRDKAQLLKVKVENSTILVTTGKYPEYKYLDKIKLTGKLETPQETDDFSYKNYLMKDGIYSVMSFPKTELLGKASGGPTSVIYSVILQIKQKIRENIQYNFSPPQSSILEGTVLGDNGAMSDDLKAKLNTTGLRHIIAVSGTHVVILSAIIVSLLIYAGLRRGQAFYITLVFIFVYVILTGLPASGVRAGIMGGLYLLAQKLGRQSMGIRIVVLACAIMLVFNPLMLIYDVGFQLSFLAVMGLIYLDQVFAKIIKIFTKDKFEALVKIVSATFAAQVFTLPIMIFNFGNVSFVSPITNLLISPVVYWLMVFGFLFSAVGMFSKFLGQILAIPCWFFLTYFVKIIDFFSQPWAIKTFEKVHWAWLVGLYLLIVIGTKYLRKKYNSDFI